MSKHYLVYQITNLVNNKIYVGIHITENVDDGYMGSGRALKRAIRKYGYDNFKREILFDFDNPEEMVLKEQELVDRKFIARKDTYNIACGGRVPMCVDTVVVEDLESKRFRVHIDDERLKSGEVVSINKRKTTVRDFEGRYYSVSVDDARLKTGELFGCGLGMLTVRDVSGKCFTLPKDHPSIKNEQLKNPFFGEHHTEEAKRNIGKANSIHQSGVGNSQYGTCWISKDGQVLKIKKDNLETYLEQGWKRGRK